VAISQTFARNSGRFRAYDKSIPMIDLLSRRDSGVWQGSVKVLFLIFIEKILDNVFWEWIMEVLHLIIFHRPRLRFV
jgi:hypothetical protein